MGDGDRLRALAGRDIQREVGKQQRAVSLGCLSGVVLRSPVLTGRFRGAWTVGVGAPQTTVPQQVDPAGAATLARGTAAIKTVKGDRPVYIENGLPYAAKLEDGGSSQAPAGVAAVTIAGLGLFGGGSRVS